MGYGRTLAGANCDVVVYGDSAAMTGIVPAVVERETGLKTCNIAEVGPVRLVGVAPTLDVYLRQNRRPRAIVLWYAPWNFRRWREEEWDRNPVQVEGIYYLLRYGNLQRSARMLLRHRHASAKYGVWVMLTEAKQCAQILLRMATGQAAPDMDAWEERMARRGVFTTNHSPQRGCMPRKDLSKDDIQADPAWAEAMRARYRESAERVLLMVSPLADCDALGKVSAERLQGLTDNRIRTLPVEMFNGEDVHFSTAGAEQTSAELALEIKESAGNQPIWQGRANGRNWSRTSRESMLLSR